MASEHPSVSGVRIVETPVDPNAAIESMTAASDSARADPTAQLLLAQARVAELESRQSSMQKDYQSLLDAKAKKDFELAALLDDNENLMATITTINADNKERMLEIRKENDVLKAKVSELEGGKASSHTSGSADSSRSLVDAKSKSAAETKPSESKPLVDSLFGSFFGAKPAPAATSVATPTSDNADANKWHEEANKLRAELEASRADHATRVKVASEERAALQSKLEQAERSAAEKEAAITKMVSVQSTVANKLIDSEAELEVSKSQLAALKLELSSRSTDNNGANSEELNAAKAELDQLRAKNEADISSFENERVSFQQTRESEAKAASEASAALEKQVQELRVQIEAMTKEKSEENVTVPVEEQIAAATAELERKLQEANESIAKAQEALQAAGEKTKMLETEKSALEAEAKQLKDSSATNLVEVEQANSNHEETARKMREEYEEKLKTLETGKSALEAELKQLKESSTTNLTEAEHLKSNHEEAVRKMREEYEEKLKILETEKSAYESEAKQLKESSSHNATEVEQLKSSHEEAIRKMREELEEKVKTLETEKSAFESEAKQLKESSSNNLAEVEQVKSAHEESIRKIREEHEEKVNKLETEKFALEAEAKQRWEAAHASLLEAEQAKSKLEETLQSERAAASDKEEKLKEAQTEISRLQTDMSASETQFKAAYTKLESATNDLISLHEANRLVTEDRDSLGFALAELKTKHEKLTEKVVALEGERNELAKACEIETLAHATSQTLVAQLQPQVKTLEANLAATTAELNSTKSEAEATKTKLSADLLASRTELEKLAAEMPMLEMRHISVKEQLERERAKTKELERDLDLEKDQTRLLTASKKELSEMLASTTSTLTNDLNTLRRESSAQAEALQNKISEIESSLAALQDTHATTCGNLESTTESLTKVTAERDSIASELASQKEEVEKSSSQTSERIASLEQQVNDKEMEAKIAEKQNLMTIQQLRAQIKALEEKPAPAPAKTHSKTASAGGTLPANSASMTKSKSTASTSAQSTPNLKNSEMKPSAPRTPLSSANTDLEAISQRIGELTQQNFTLQEQLKAAMEAQRKAEKESRLKSQWIRQHSPKLQGLTDGSQNASTSGATAAAQRADGGAQALSASTGSVANVASPNAAANAKRTGSAQMKSNNNTPTRRPQESGFFSSLFGSSPAPRDPQPVQLTEHQQSMGALLEDTLLAKMQLEDEVKLISADVETLQLQNRLLMEKLVANSIDVPVLGLNTETPANDVQ